MTKKVTYNGSTKQQIFDAYTEVLENLKLAQSQKLDPAREVAVKKSEATLSKAEETASKSVEDQIASLQKNIAGILGNLSNSFAVEIEAYNNLKESIKLKEAELKELFDIEKQSFTLAALIDTHKEVSAKQSAENIERISKAREELDLINEQIRNARIEHQEQIKQERAALKVERDRDQEVYEYEFKRRKQMDEDQLNDELDAKRKQLNLEAQEVRAELSEKEAVLYKREVEVAERELKFDELEAAVAAFPERESQIRLEVTEQVKKDEARTAAIKDSYAKREAENQKTIYENKIELLEKSLESEQLKNSELAAKLDAAYDKIQNMALASVDGTKAQNASADLMKSLMQNNK